MATGDPLKTRAALVNRSILLGSVHRGVQSAKCEVRKCRKLSTRAQQSIESIIDIIDKLVDGVLFLPDLSFGASSRACFVN